MRLLIALLLLSTSASARTPQSDVTVLAAYLEAIRGPALPDSLADRPRVTTGASPDRLAPYTAPGIPQAWELEDDELDRQLAQGDVGGIRWYLGSLKGWHVLVFSMKNCPPCRAYAEGGLADLVSEHWPIDQRDVEKHAALAEWFDVTATPTTIALVDGKEVGRIVGNTSAVKVRALFSQKPAAKPAPKVSGAATDCRFLRGQWTWPGNTLKSLRAHLTSPPHSMSPSKVSAMTGGQLVAAHDAWHNRNGAWPPIRKPSRASPRNCPSGNCPSVRRR